MIIDGNVFHSGVVLQLAAAWLTLMLAYTLYVVLGPVGRSLALFALVFRAIEAALFGVSATAGIVALDFLREPHLVAVIAPNQAVEFAGLLLRLHGISEFTAITFYAFGSAAFFWLFFRGGCIPRMLSFAGIIGTVLLFVWSLAGIILPSGAEWPGIYFWLPISLAEIAVGVWLLARGVAISR